MSSKFDFLDALGRRFTSPDEFIDYLENDLEIGTLPGDFNILGAVNDLPSKEAFKEEIERMFEVVESTGDLLFIRRSVEQENVYHYVYLQDDFPLFFTKANKTDEIPPTIEKFLQYTQGVGRLVLSRRQIDLIRKDLASRHDDLLVPFFSARRSPDSNISARRRPGVKRSIQYRADDGLEAYREMRYNYGILPKIMVFERPNHFKFRVKQNGIFVHQSGTIYEMWDLLQKEIERADDIVRYSNTGEYGQVSSSFFEGKQVNVSSPWAIEVDSGIKEEPIKNFEQHMNEDFWEFGVSEYLGLPKVPRLEAELIDESSYERVVLRSKKDEIRVFPRELTDVDQSIRLFNFVSDHFDSTCTARKVA
ncbi:hypothetical protein ACYJ1Y_15885 [Natrialbaceae archaeon A-gly3]